MEARMVRIYGLVLALVLGGCARHKVLRDAATFQLEVQASLARQLEAAEKLREAATAARDAGDYDTCARYAQIVVLIDAAAKAQADRALWLADLPYPGGPEGEQPDPGPSKPIAPISTLCGDP